MAATSADKRQWTKWASTKSGTVVCVWEGAGLLPAISYCLPGFYLWVLFVVNNELYKNIRETRGRERKKKRKKERVRECTGLSIKILENICNSAQLYQWPHSIPSYILLPYRSPDHSGIYSCPRGPLYLEESWSCSSTEHQTQGVQPIACYSNNFNV